MYSEIYNILISRFWFKSNNVDFFWLQPSMIKYFNIQDTSKWYGDTCVNLPERPSAKEEWENVPRRRLFITLFITPSYRPPYFYWCSVIHHHYKPGRQCMYWFDRFINACDSAVFGLYGSIHFGTSSRHWSGIINSLMLHLKQVEFGLANSASAASVRGVCIQPPSKTDSILYFSELLWSYELWLFCLRSDGRRGKLLYLNQILFCALAEPNLYHSGNRSQTSFMSHSLVFRKHQKCCPVRKGSYGPFWTTMPNFLFIT